MCQQASFRKVQKLRQAYIHTYRSFGTRQPHPCRVLLRCESVHNLTTLQRPFDSAIPSSLLARSTMPDNFPNYQNWICAPQLARFTPIARISSEWTCSWSRSVHGPLCNKHWISCCRLRCLLKSRKAFVDKFPSDSKGHYPRDT